MKKLYIEQQETIIPEERRLRKVVTTVKIPKRRGRKKSTQNVRRMLFWRRIYQVAKHCPELSREEFAAAIGLNPLCVNTMAAAFIRCTDEEMKQQQELQDKLDKYYCKSRRLTSVPLLDAENVLNHDFEIKNPLNKQEAVSITKEPKYGDRLHYFAFTMPDNCMVHDGICKDDKIVAARNLRPGNGDLVACRIPGVKTITVRRFRGTSNPSLYFLYEGGMVNPLFAAEIEKLIYGVVVGLERAYWPRRLPRPWEPVR